MPKKIIEEEKTIGTIPITESKPVFEIEPVKEELTNIGDMPDEIINKESQGGNMDELLLQKAKVIALKHGVAAAIELVDEVVALALQEAAAKSENKIDDAVVAVLIEPLKVAIKEQLNKLLV